MSINLICDFSQLTTQLSQPESRTMFREELGQRLFTKTVATFDKILAIKHIIPSQGNVTLVVALGLNPADVKAAMLHLTSDPG